MQTILWLRKLKPPAIALMVFPVLLIFGSGATIKCGTFEYQAKDYTSKIILLGGAGFLLAFPVTMEWREKGENKNTNPKGILKCDEARDTAFQNLRTRAKKSIYMIGVGFSDVSEDHLLELEKDAQRVAITILMVNPDYLTNNPQLALELGKFYEKMDLVKQVRDSYDKIVRWAKELNSKGNGFRLKVYAYNEIPSSIMVLIDPEERGGLIVEYPSSKRRLRTRVELPQATHQLEWFDYHYDSIQQLINRATKII